MNRYAFILLLLLLVAVSAKASDGDITGVAVEANGWIADVYVASSGAANTNGTLANGLGSNNALTGSEKFKLNITSCGYDNTGATTTVARVVYGTKLVRFPYPYETFSDSTNDGSTLKIKVALSDYVYTKDSISSASISSGLYSTNSLSSYSSTWSTVTNGSTNTYPRAIAQWSWPGYEVISTTSHPRVCAFGFFAADGNPVKCVEFTETDGATVITNIVTSPSIDYTVGDALPVIEYVGSISVSGLNAGTITRNFKAFPRIGDASSVVNSADGVNTEQCYYSPQYYVNNKDGGYGPFYAVVDPANGNDTSGRASATLIGATATPFLSIAAAANKIAASNNTYCAHNDIGGGIIYLTNGNHTFTGGTVSATTKPAAWLTITSYPGSGMTNVVLVSASGTKDLADRFKLQDVRIESTATAMFGGGVETIWIDRCYINTTTDARPLERCTNVFLTRSTVNALSQGLTAYSGSKTVFPLIRGNIDSNTGKSVQMFTVLGNVFNGLGTSKHTFVTTGLSTSELRDSTNGIFAFNKTLNQYDCSFNICRAGSTNETLNGFAVIQNCFEGVKSNSGPNFTISWSNGSDETNRINNCLVWYNTSAGARVNLGENGDGTTYAERRNWEIKNNVWTDANTKHDLDYTDNGARTGGWPISYGVGQSGNLDNESDGLYDGGSFLWMFIGISSVQNNASPVSVIGFADYKAIVGINQNGTGNGTYSLTSASPARTIAVSRMLPYDLSGTSRYDNGAAGAYEYPQTVTVQQRPFDNTQIILRRLRR